ncbi:CPBP family intramembrane glutamic endopeptidase [Aureivirga marina]|uniref:CPBP family intramembrane glutamic endopeptidase n=1 Tax=Aureivirga marina TaxID=1182451 RepID=UPI001E5CB4E4|nr:CPBP family intramembrane glutamic endopeptidase [Aureivirga marina]
MQNTITETKETWRTIGIFLVIVTILSAIFHYAIVNLYPSRIYIGGLMWCPAIATFITLKIKKRPIYSLKWNWGNWKYIRLSYLTPALYATITYLLIWLLGFGDIANSETLQSWAKEIGLIGIGTLSTTSIVIIGILLVGTISVIRASATVLGEEIGWRGFFIFELRKVLSFTGVSLFSGFIWATWHWPLIVYYGGNIALELTTFYIVIISMSFMMTYYTFKAKSLWPAVIFHAVSNIYIQKILPELTIEKEGMRLWYGEYGIMFAIVTFVFGIYFWRKAIKEKM